MKFWSRVSVTLMAIFVFCLTAQAGVTVTYQEGVSGYTGAESVFFNHNTIYHTSNRTTHYYRYDSTRYYSLEYFGGIDMSSWGTVTNATLTLYRAGGVAYNGTADTEDIYLRRINDPDSLGIWKVGANGWSTGATKRHRDGTTSLKWQSSDPTTDGDHFEGILESTNNAPFFTVTKASDAIGHAYVIDVTDDVEAWRDGSTPNQGWATYHGNAALINISDWIGSGNHATAAYRPLLTVTYDTGGATTYTLTVNNGTGSGDYPETTAVSIAALNAPAGETFAAWTGDIANIADVNSSSTTLTMPAAAQTITATYSNLPLHALTVNNGTGDGDYYMGQVVNITADAPPAGQGFVAWTGDVTGVAFINDYSTTFTMPNSVASITATYEALQIITVATNGTADYSSIDAAYEAASSSGSNTLVKIMDSGIYDELVSVPGAGAAGISIIIRPDAGQTPSVYAIEMYDDTFNTTFEGMIIDGGIRDYTLGAPAVEALVYIRGGKANYTVKDCTIKGRGIASYNAGGSAYVYSGISGKTWIFDGNLFEADGSGVNTMGIYAGEANNAGSSIIIKNNTITDSSTSALSFKQYNPASGDVIFEYNVINGGNNGIYNKFAAGGLSNLTIVHNTFHMVGGTDSFLHGAIVMRDANDGTFGPLIKDNLIMGTGGADYDGFSNGKTAGLTDINADYNGFYNMNVSGIAYLSSAWKSITDLNGYASSGNNVIGDSDPFVNAAAGDFHLTSGSWALTSGSDGGYIGALTMPPPSGFFMIIR